MEQDTRLSTRFRPIRKKPFYETDLFISFLNTHTVVLRGIEAAAAQDYEMFYEQETAYREMMGYPPAENLTAVHVSCEDEELLEKGCHYLKEYILRIKGNVPVRGP